MESTSPATEKMKNNQVSERKTECITRYEGKEKEEKTLSRSVQVFKRLLKNRQLCKCSLKLNFCSLFVRCYYITISIVPEKPHWGGDNKVCKTSDLPVKIPPTIAQSPVRKCIKDLK